MVRKGSGARQNKQKVGVCLPPDGAAVPLLLSPDCRTAMDEMSADPGLLPASEEDDDSHQVLGHFNADELDDEEGFGVASPPPEMPADELVEPDDPVDQEEEEENVAERTSASHDDDDDDGGGGEDSDDEEIKKLEAEANVASDEENEDASGAPPMPKSGTADGQLIADIFGDS